jgi:hypothetical protein
VIQSRTADMGMRGNGDMQPLALSRSSGSDVSVMFWFNDARQLEMH